MLKNLVKGALNIFWPVHCEICKLPLDIDAKSLLCGNCFEKIKFNKLPFCKKCGKSISGEKEFRDFCRDCRANSGFYFDRVYSACIYEGILKQALHIFKYNGSVQLGRTLAGILLKFYRDNLSEKKFDYLIPIPLYPAKEREREFNQALILSEPISKSYSTPIAKNALIKIKRTPSQTTLSKEKRLLSQKGAFRVKKPIFANKKLLIIDDIFTTGSTMNEAAFVLKNAGASEVCGLTLIRGIPEYVER